MSHFFLFLLGSEKLLKIWCLHFACILLSLSHCNIRLYTLVVAMQEILSIRQWWRILTELVCGGKGDGKMPHLCIGTSAAILKKSHFMHGAVSRTVEKNLFYFSMALPCIFVRWVKGDQVVHNWQRFDDWQTCTLLLSLTFLWWNILNQSFGRRFLI